MFWSGLERPINSAENTKTLHNSKIPSYWGWNIQGCFYLFYSTGSFVGLGGFYFSHGLFDLLLI